MTNNQGQVVPGSQARYFPFGDWRRQPTADLTDMGFTGHKSNNVGNNDIGLIYMNARYYVVGIGRFASADTLVPDPTNPQQYNRYTYSLNNPIRNSDPTGHMCYDHTAGPALPDACINESSSAPSAATNATPFTSFLINFEGDGWTDGEKSTINASAMAIALAYANTWNERHMAFGEQQISAQEAFLAVHGGPVTFKRTTAFCSTGCYGERTGKGVITVYADARNIAGNRMWAMHEIFHDFNGNAIPAGATLGQPYLDLEANPIKVNNDYISPFNGAPRQLKGYLPGGDYPGDRTPYVNSWQDTLVREDFADMGANWVANSFAPDIYGAARYTWIDNGMPNWIDLAIAHNR